MKKKLVLLTLLIFFLTGCDLDYNVKINEDLTTSETINFSVEQYYIDEKNELYSDSYTNERLDYIISTLKDDGYKYEYSTDDGISGIATRNNTSFVLNEYIMTKSYKYYDYYCNDTYCTLYAINKDDNYPSNDSMYDLKISIQVPYEVIKNNADEIDKLTNTYTWNNNADTSIELIFKKSGTNIINKNKIIYFIKIGLFGIIGLLGIFFVVKIILRIKRNNSY